MSDLFVPGIPRPQGSKRCIPLKGGRRCAAVESSSGLKDWRGDVRRAAVDLGLGGPTTAALHLYLEFVMPRPKSHYRTGKHADELKPNSPLTHTSRPDLDKLIRGVKDALSGVLYADDSQVCSLHATKQYGEAPGVRIRLEPENPRDSMDTADSPMEDRGRGDTQRKQKPNRRGGRNAVDAEEEAMGRLPSRGRQAATRRE